MYLEKVLIISIRHIKATVLMCIEVDRIPLLITDMILIKQIIHNIVHSEMDNNKIKIIHLKWIFIILILSKYSNNKVANIIDQYILRIIIITILVAN